MEVDSTMDRRLLGWGLFFIILGAIPLAVRAGLLSAELVGRWPTLWPLLLIAWGVGLLLRATPIDWLGGGLTAIAFGLMGGGALASGFSGVPAMTGCGGDAAGAAFAEQRGTLSTDGQINVEFNCGTLTAQTVDGSDWTVNGSGPRGRGPDVDVDGSTVALESRSSSLFDSGGRTSWTVGVPRDPVIGMGLTLNAGDATVALQGVHLSSANLTVNAGSARVDLAGAAQLGDVNGTVNLGSATLQLPAGGRTVNLSLNAGSLTVCLPAGAPLRVRWSGTLGSEDLLASGLTEVGDRTWVSAGFDESQPHVELRVSANAGSFDLDRSGSCSG